VTLKPPAFAVVSGSSSTQVRPGASDTTAPFEPVKVHGSVTYLRFQVTLVTRPSRRMYPLPVPIVALSKSPDPPMCSA